MRLALLSVALIALTAFASGGRVDAQASPPTRFFGTLTIDGQVAGPLTDVNAEVNGIICSVPKGIQLTQGINYAVDAESGATISGCGVDGQPVFFKVGNRYAAEVGTFASAQFVRLDLTISGAGARPIVAGATPAPTPTPEATPAATATPAPAATATPAPAQLPFVQSVLDLNSPCIPELGASVCSAGRQALWTGDAAAWAAQGVTNADERFTRVFELRGREGDPAAVAAVAKGQGWPHNRIVGARYRDTGGTPFAGEWVEVRNLGGGDQDMTGWSVRVDGTQFAWRFADGFILRPDQSCRFYTLNAEANACPGSANINSTGVLDDQRGGLSLWVDFLDLRAITVTYAADRLLQPAPPNLQGVQ